MRNVFNKLFKSRFSHWLDRRIPKSKSITLNQRRIFIFPSQPGRWFIILLLVMLLAAINYQNNMAFALVFLLTSVYIVSILHSYANLSGLTIQSLQAEPTFAGSHATCHLSVNRQGAKEYFDVSFSWPDSDVCSVSLTDNNAQAILLNIPVTHRGLFTAPRLLVESYYPVGLLRTWTWLSMDISLLVYPQPMPCSLENALAGDDSSNGDVSITMSGDDFYQFKNYQRGDALKHVYWKGFAKGQPLQSKHYAAYREQQLWLDFNSFSGDEETRLSKLCYWIVKLERSNTDYGLRLATSDFSPSHGALHQKKLLEALALYNTEVKSL